MKGKNRLQEMAKKLIVFVLTFGVFFTSSAQVAHAQWATTNPDTLANDLATTVQQETQGKVKGALLGALAGIGVSLLNYVATITAQSTAVWIANGGAGKHPLFNNQTMEEVGQSISATIASDVLDQIVPGSGTLLALGINPDNPELSGLLRKLIGSSYRPVDLTEDGRIDGGSIGRNFSSYIAATAAVAGAPGQAADMQTARILRDTMNAVSTNEFYGLLRAYGQTTARAGNVAAVGQYQNMLNAGFRDLTSPISQRTKWPAQNVKRQLDEAISNKKQADADGPKSLVAAAGENAMIQIGINVLTTFAGTLFGELTNKLFTGLFDGIDPVMVDPFNPTQVAPGRSGEDLFRSLGTFQPLKATGYSLMSQLASCPASLLRQSRGVYTCAMDTAFVSVVARGGSNNPSTLKEAIGSGEINGNWPLIGPTGDLNQDPNCYQRAFCHSNLLKMRKARIIPIGWEMASELSDNGRYTLKQAMDGFHDCNENGERDSAHPLCKLVDPNWILRAPEAVCRTLAYGQQLATSAGANRAEECVDIQTCLDEDGSGECKGGFGYCVREANIWRFRGDACSAENASCQALATRDNKQVSYLLSTVDYAECGPDKVGCRWYETEKKVDTEGVFDWPLVTDIEKDGALVPSGVRDNFKPRVYANAKIETCEDEGCRELLVRDQSLTLNMVKNGSFEDDTNSSGFPDAWLKGDSNAELVRGAGVAGGTALRNDASVVYPGLLFRPGYSYVISFSARIPEGGTASTVSADLEIYPDDMRGAEVDPGAGFVAFDFTGYRLEGINGASCAQVPGTGMVRLSKAITVDAPYEKVGCLLTIPNLPDSIRNVAGTLSLRTAPGGLAFFDDVQVEQNGQMSSFAFGYSAAAPRTYAKLPPAYLGCTGSSSDAPECAQYSKMCSPLDEGCKLYTPANGDPAVSAIVGAGNACPAVCTGYDTYKQEPTRYEPVGVFPEHFIATTATTCSANAVGCSEFTNLTTEAREYYTYLRACLSNVRAGDREGVFYTWEGTDTEGYQIKTWKLLVTNMTTQTSVDPVYAEAPCTQWSATANGITCQDDLSADMTGTDGIPDALSNPACDERSDIYSNPDCREFYDSNGNIHYRLWSDTVTVNETCTSYRKTEIAGEDAPAQVTNCTASGGYFDAPNGACIYYGYNVESTTCSAAENGCRQYTGGRGNNSRIVLEELFEANSTLIGWDAQGTGAIERSTESLANEGHSIRSVGTRFWTYYSKLQDGTVCGTQGGCTDKVSRFGEECTIQEGRSVCGAMNQKLFTGKTYTLQFWAKGSGSMQVGFANKAPATEGNVQITEALTFKGSNESATIDLSTEWREYRLGPIDVNELDYPDFGPESVLVFTPVSGTTVYVDTIVLREGEENLALIRDSWSTPAVCDTDGAGSYTPQFHLGCRQYTSSTNQTVYLKSFSRLCGDGAIGCTAYYDTQATEASHGQVFNAVCNRVVTAPSSVLAERVDCRLESNTDSPDGYLAESPRLCTILPNQTSCRFNLSQFLMQEGGPDTIQHIQYLEDTQVVKPDMPVYAIVTRATQCNSAEAGCTEVGVPVLSADQSRVVSWESTNLLLQPSSFAQTLCHAGDLFCEEFTDARRNKYYFKSPEEKVCEYRARVSIAGREYSGWFVKGTTNFCYGTGTCSANPGTACTLDSDCPVVGTGTCSVFGTACSQDRDCRLNEQCIGAESDTCRISAGSYIVAGTESGLWRNGDDGYDGWVGTCSPENSGCREFLDPLDGIVPDMPYGQADPKAYYYIENENLGDANVTGTRRCSGQASTEEGCILFHDTSLPRLLYSTSATAIASRHADTLFGNQKYDLVTPLNCEDGSVRSTITTPSGQLVDLCAQRCVYDRFQVNNVGNNYTAADGNRARYASVSELLRQKLSDALRFAGGAALTQSDIDQAYVFGGSCLVDTDCNPMRSREGAMVTGSCLGQIQIQARPGGGGIGTGTTTPTTATTDGTTAVVSFSTAVPRLENDTNRILKVNRSRTCKEWIAPHDCRRVWDAQTGQFREQCAELQLCQEYDESGASACKTTKIYDAAIAVDADFYTTRDVSWYGNDYSGYAIGGQFLLHHLSQEQVNLKRVCVITDADEKKTVVLDANGNPVECTNACAGFAVCENHPDPEYALVYNAGSCRGVATNQSCNIGYCANSGASCASDGQCPGSSCVVGTCVVPTTTRCTQNADCGSASAVCNAGICEEEFGAQCSINNVSDADGTIGCAAQATGLGITNAASAFCRTSASFREGRCINENCLLTPTGEQYPRTIDDKNAQSSFGKVCRAHPEVDSPFSNQVVRDWNQFVNTGANRWGVESVLDIASEGAYPYSVRAGFENANICGAGQVCECSYKKLTASGNTQYVEFATDVDSLAKLVATASKALGPSDNRVPTLGICAGGPAAGAFCTIVDDIEYGCKSDPGRGASETGAGNIASGSFGTCNPISRADDMVGLKGYCLERDTAININGDQNMGACLTYFPIDELLGETDLNAKHKSAGYFEDTHYCSDIKNYANLTPVLGCVRTSTGVDNGVVPSPCVQDVKCPSGYFAIVSDRRIASGDHDSNFNNMCGVGEMGGGSQYWGGPNWDDSYIDSNDPSVLKLRPYGGSDGVTRACPFACIPEDAIFKPESEYSGSCQAKAESITKFATSKHGTRIHYVSYESIDNEWDQFKSCTSYGYDVDLDPLYVNPFRSAVRLGSEMAPGPNGLLVWGYENSGDIRCRGGCTSGEDVVMQDPYRLAEWYPACRELTKVASSGGDRSGYPFTNRILGNEYQDGLPGNPAGFYERRTLGNRLFGASISPQEANSRNYFGQSGNLHPAVIPTCRPRGWAFGGALTSLVTRSFYYPIYAFNPGFLSGPGAGNMLRVGLLSDPTACESQVFSDIPDKFGFVGVGQNPELRDTFSPRKLPIFPSFGNSGIVQALPFIGMGIHDGNAYDFEVSYSTLGQIGSTSIERDGRREGTMTFEDANFQTLDGFGTVVDVLSHIFAKPIELWSFGEERYERVASLPNTYEQWDERARRAQPPVVKSLSNLGCTGRNCPEGRENRISVNRQDSGDQEDDGTMRVTLEFFAMADKNQLPIRRIIVDWGDRLEKTVENGRLRGATDTENYFKNFRGLDENGNQICGENNEWGKTEASCEPTYLRFTKTYACTHGIVEELSLNGQRQCDDELEDAPCVIGTGPDAVCVFRPAVHVRDNWGWCTGACTANVGEDGNSEACFDVTGDLGVSSSLSECAYDLHPESGDPNDPWVRYDGVIRIKQQQ